MKLFTLLALVLLALQYCLSQEIPAGTALPVMVTSSLDARRDKPGQPIVGRLMQDVPLPSGGRLSAGTRLLGRVVDVVSPAPTAHGSRLTVEFDRLEQSGRIYPLTTSLRALASMMEVFDAQLPTTAFDDFGTSSADWTTIQVGGDVVYRRDGKVFSKYNDLVGTATLGGAVMAKLQPVPKAGCRAGFEANDSAQALWVFSASACGPYGFSDLQVSHAGRTSPVGQIELQSGGNVHVNGGSGWLLRVDSSARQTVPQ